MDIATKPVSVTQVPEESETVSLARIVVQEYDMQLLDSISDVSEKLSRAIPPDRKLDVLEKLAHDYAVLATVYGARAHYILRYIEKEDLWMTRQTVVDGQVTREFKVFAEYRDWYITNVIKKASQSTYWNYKDLIDRLEGMQFTDEEVIELMESPSRTRQALGLIHFDGAKQMDGIESGDDGKVLERMKSEIGWESGDRDDVEEIARQFVKQSATADDVDTREVVQRTAGGWFAKQTYADDAKGGGPRITYTGWSSQHRGRYENTFYLDKGEKLHPQLKLLLEKHRSKSFVGGRK